MAFRARKVSGAFEKRVPEIFYYQTLRVFILDFHNESPYRSFFSDFVASAGILLRVLFHASGKYRVFSPRGTAGGNPFPLVGF